MSVSDISTSLCRIRIADADLPAGTPGQYPYFWSRSNFGQRKLNLLHALQILLEKLIVVVDRKGFK